MSRSKWFGLLALVFSGLNPLALSAASISPGDLVISEVMANPSAVSDFNGEWFELHNLSGNSLDLNGITMSDDDTDLHVVDFGGPLIINPNDYLVFGRNGNTSSNGGYAADYVYSGFTLSNGSDEIILSTGSVEIVRLEYTSGFSETGVSRELAGTVGFLLDGTDYALSTSPYGDGDLGTPGVAGGSSWTLVTTPVPVPAAVWLFGTGLVGLMGVVRRRSGTTM